MNHDEEIALRLVTWEQSDQRNVGLYHVPLPASSTYTFHFRDPYGITEVPTPSKISIMQIVRADGVGESVTSPLKGRRCGG